MSESPIDVLLVASGDRGQLDAARLDDESGRLVVTVETSLAEAKSEFTAAFDCVVVGDDDVDWSTLFEHVRERAPDTSCLLFTETPVDELEWGEEPLAAEYLSRTWGDAYARLAECIETSVDAGVHRSYPVPPDERERAAAVERYDVDALREWGTLDTLTGLGAATFDVPVAILGFVDRQSYRTIACNASVPDEWPRQDAGCVYTVLERGFCEIPDLSDDPRYGSGMAVEEFGMRSYGGVPLLTEEGQPVGTFCVMDTEPRSLDAGEHRRLEQFAEIAMALVERHGNDGDAADDVDRGSVSGGDRAGAERRNDGTGQEGPTG